MISKAFSSAKIFGIGRHRFEIDGKGIRTLVIFADCPLRCKYCFNSYTWNGSREGTVYTPEMLLQNVSVDSVYFQATNGGVTFGGGEPLLNAEFISDFIDIAPRTWNFYVQTSLAIPFEKIDMLVDKIETFVVDIKSMNKDIYKSYTGGELSLAKNNFKKLLNLVGKERIVVRVPLIPKYANHNSQIQSVTELYKLGISNIDLFSYKVF